MAVAEDNSECGVAVRSAIEVSDGAHSPNSAILSLLSFYLIFIPRSTDSLQGDSLKVFGLLDPHPHRDLVTLYFAQS